MSYNKCICQNCGSTFATVISSDAELLTAKCPQCGESKLKLSGKVSLSELNSLFSGGG